METDFGSAIIFFLPQVAFIQFLSSEMPFY